MGWDFEAVVGRESDDLAEGHMYKMNGGSPCRRHIRTELSNSFVWYYTAGSTMLVVTSKLHVVLRFAERPEVRFQFSLFLGYTDGTTASDLKISAMKPESRLYISIYFPVVPSNSTPSAGKPFIFKQNTLFRELSITLAWDQPRLALRVLAWDP
jgi:hypothetical protein